MVTNGFRSRSAPPPRRKASNKRTKYVCSEATILDKIYPHKSHFTPPAFHNVVNLEKHLDFGHFYKLQLLQQHCKKGNFALVW